MSVVLCDATLPPRLNWAINCKQAHLINNKPRKSITSQITLSLFIGTRLNPFRMEPFEQEKDVSFKSGKRRSGSKTSLIFLSVLSFILLVISIVFITLYALEKTKKTSAPQIPKEQKYCGSKACFDAAKGRIKCISCKPRVVSLLNICFILLKRTSDLFFLTKGRRKWSWTTDTINP